MWRAPVSWRAGTTAVLFCCPLVEVSAHTIDHSDGLLSLVTCAGNVVLNDKFYRDTSGNILNEICE